MVAGAITVLAVILHLMRIHYAGSPWRDEVAVLNLARMSWHDLLHYFPHEAFPLFFSLLLRGYTSVAGTGEMSLRIFGFIIGIGCLGTLWLNARLGGLRLPLLALPIFAFSSVFFIWGDSVRGYGPGTVFLMLSFTLMARSVVQPSPRVFFALLVSAILSVQCLLANSVFLFAVGMAAATVHLIQGRRRNTG